METNPQAEQMAHESMARTLAAQAEAIWPQERVIIDRHGLPAAARILDVGCGTGEIVRRLADHLPAAEILGVDIHPAYVEAGRRRCAACGDRVRFRTGDAFALDLPGASFDLVLCRHLLQAVPAADRLVAELVRLVRPGGVVHLVAEDYGMMHFHPVTRDTDDFWRHGPMVFAQRTGTDLRSGRKMYTVLRRLGLDDVRVDYVVIDTTRVPREVFAAIWTAWRDGYAEAIARHTDLLLADVLAAFDEMIAAIVDPDGYGVWQLPIVTGRVPLTA